MSVSMLKIQSLNLVVVASKKTAQKFYCIWGIINVLCVAIVEKPFNSGRWSIQLLILGLPPPAIEGAVANTCALLLLSMADMQLS